MGVFLAQHELRGQRRGRLIAEIEAGWHDDPGPGGWAGGFANQAHWDPGRSRDWRCWAQSGPTWSAHCGAEVAACDSLGLCARHRWALLEGPPVAEATGPGARPLVESQQGGADSQDCVGASQLGMADSQLGMADSQDSVGNGRLRVGELAEAVQA
jgi:hypothetical protein